LTAFLEVVLPVATQFDPDLVLVSAGFDAAMGDPLGKCQVTPMAYALMTKYLSVLAEGRVILALEGGYNLKSIAECMTACGAALLGCPLPRMEAVFRKPLHYRDREAIQKVKDELRSFWPLLDARVAEEEKEEEGKEENGEQEEKIKDGKVIDDIKPAEMNDSTKKDDTDVNRNLRPKSESDDLADVFEALTIESAPLAAADASVSQPADVATSTPNSTASRIVSRKLDPDLKIKMAEFDLKLAQVPAVVAPEVQEEAKHLIRVLVLGQEGAKAYEEALDGDGSDGAQASVPAIPLVAPSTPLGAALSSTASNDLDGQSPKLLGTPKTVLALEDSGILEPVAEDAELKMEEA